MLFSITILQRLKFEVSTVTIEWPTRHGMVAQSQVLLRVCNGLAIARLNLSGARGGEFW